MAFTKEKRLERWIRQIAFGVHEDRLEALVIRHAKAGSNKGGVVFTRKIQPDNPITVDNMAAWVDDLLEIIDSDASGLGGLQRYAIEAMREGCSTPDSRYVCRVEGHDKDVDDGDEFDTESPSIEGITSQQMRHTEVLARQLSMTSGSALQAMSRIIDRQATHIEAMMEQRIRSIEVVEEAMTRKHERDMELLESSSKEQRKDQAVEQLLLLAPAVVNRLGGKKLVPEAATPREMMLKGFIDSLEQSQFEGIASKLTPAQQITLVQLLQEFKADEKEDGHEHGEGA
jgi:hypothetical protein